jgi:hypothetical protein
MRMPTAAASVLIAIVPYGAVHPCQRQALLEADLHEPVIDLVAVNMQMGYAFASLHSI